MVCPSSRQRIATICLLIKGIKLLNPYFEFAIFLVGWDEILPVTSSNLLARLQYLQNILISLYINLNSFLICRHRKIENGQYNIVGFRRKYAKCKYGHRRGKLKDGALHWYIL